MASLILGQNMQETALASRMGEDAPFSSLQGATHWKVSLNIDLHNLQLFNNHISEQGVTREIARLASLGLQHAGDWLNVVPSPALGLHLPPAEFIMSAGKCTACPHQSDAKGDHAISYGYEGEKIARHDHITDALHNTCVYPGLLGSHQ